MSLFPDGRPTHLLGELSYNSEAESEDLSKNNPTPKDMTQARIMRSSCGFLGDRNCAQAVLAGVCAVPATSATKSGPTHLRGPAARADCALCGRRPAVPVATQGPGTTASPARHGGKSGTYLKRNQSKRCENERTLSSEI